MKNVEHNVRKHGLFLELVFSNKTNELHIPEQTWYEDKLIFVIVRWQASTGISGGFHWNTQLLRVISVYPASASSL